MYVFIKKKKTINTAKCVTTALTVHLHRHDVSTVILDHPITFEDFVLVLIRVKIV